MIKYGELTTKKANRSFFINLLTKNIENVLKDLNIKIIKDRVRMYIYSVDSSIIVERLKKIFGIHSIVICEKVDTNISEIQKISLELLKDYKTFKVATKRADKNFEIHSMDFNNIIGGYILKNSDLKVDVHNPDVILHIEIRREGTFIYTNEIKGIGGYPVGIQGKGFASRRIFFT